LNLNVAPRHDFSYYIVVGKKSTVSNQISTEQRAKVFKALSDPTRLRMVEMLSNCEQMCGTEIAENLGISLALLCHHWKTLEHAGLVVKKKEGQTASISLNRQLLSDCFRDVIE
jgi:DNA-binding transcriptional ArsR family regulator